MYLPVTELNCQFASPEILSDECGLEERLWCEYVTHSGGQRMEAVEGGMKSSSAGDFAKACALWLRREAGQTSIKTHLDE